MPRPERCQKFGLLHVLYRSCRGLIELNALVVNDWIVLVSNATQRALVVIASCAAGGLRIRQILPSSSKRSTSVFN